MTESSPVEFSACTNKYFIELDKKNNWHVIVQSQCKTWPKKGSFAFVSVQRFANDSAGRPVGAALPGAVDMPLTAYALVLRDKTGRVRWEL